MNNPTNWNPDVDTGSFEFASPDEAKRAEVILNNAMRESYEAGVGAGRNEGNREAEHLRMQIGYIATQLMIRGDTRTLPEIVEEAAKATSSPSAPSSEPSSSTRD